MPFQRWGKPVRVGERVREIWRFGTDSQGADARVEPADHRGFTVRSGAETSPNTLNAQCL